MHTMYKSTLILLLGIFAIGAYAKDIVHDAEYYILKSQNGEK